MRILKRLFRRPGDDERGAAFVLTAISMVLLLWAGATGVDVGFTVYGSRQAQAIADTAALDLARYINYADTLPSIASVNSYFNDPTTGKLAAVLKDNDSDAQLTAVPGYYNSSTKQFTVDGYTGTTCQPIILAPITNDPGCNAVEVTANQSVPQVFFGGFNMLPGHASHNASGSAAVSGSVSGSSIAAQNPVAGFSIGTYLVNLNTNQSAVLNPLLSLLGSSGPSSVNLTAVGYQGLVTDDVTLADLISASGGLLSATNIMTQSLSAGQWLSIYETAVVSDYGTGSIQSTSLQALGSFSTAQSTDVRLCDMAWVNVASAQYNCSNSSISQQGLDASMNVLQMLTTEAELANGTNGTNGIDLTAALNLTSALSSIVPGLSIGNVMLKTTVISPPHVAYGPVGTTASDAQVQATLSMNLTLLGIPLGSLNIPLSAATGTATLQSMICNGDSLYSMTIQPINTNAVSTGTSGNGVTLTLLGVPTTEGSLQISPKSGSAFFTGPANPAGSDIPPTPSTATANPPNPASMGSTTPSFTFTAAPGANSSVTATMGVLATAYGPDLQALGLTIGGATVAGLSANCGTVSLVQ